VTERRYLPRKIGLGPLIDVLVKEHSVMKEGLLRAEDAANRGNFETVSQELKDLDPVFRQHIADEESQILGMLVRLLGVAGAKEEIKVFQQHRPIYQLMRNVTELAAMSTAELQANQTKLNALFDEHAAAEEERVFPRARSLDPREA
jgi:hemerythrin-like domain-containing protein